MNIAEHNWIPVEWEPVDQFWNTGLDSLPRRIKIRRMVSPFYPGERFAVKMDDWCLNKSGEWEWEPLPSSRTDEFYERCRFPTFRDAIATLLRAPSNQTLKVDPADLAKRNQQFMGLEP